MPTTDNGWPASPNLKLRPLVVEGVAFAPGIADNDDVETVLRYVMEQYAARVEPLRSPGCWGFAYRANANDPNALSRHSGGIAIDVNAPAHPNGVPTGRTFTPAQIVEVHRILLEVKSSIRWGGDYHGNPDAMHFEVNVDAATLRGVAEGLRDDMPYTEAELTVLIRNAVRAEIEDMTAGKPDGSDLTRDQLAKQTHKAADEARDLLKKKP